MIARRLSGVEGADRSAEAKEALDRVHRDAEVIGTSRLAEGVARATAHLTGADADRTDPVELWGTRIGRLLGAAAFVALAAYLLFTYVLR